MCSMSGRKASLVLQQNYVNLEFRMQKFIWKKLVVSRDAKLAYMEALRSSNSLKPKELHEMIKELKDLSAQVERQGELVYHFRSKACVLQDSIYEICEIIARRHRIRKTIKAYRDKGGSPRRIGRYSIRNTL